jgi:crotonobetainyl-CoA:carnitine CoA-transferase CaiB-like acyl-CoA transferase
MEEPQGPDKGHPSGPLRGLKVLELGHFIAGPFCTRLLGDLGADVVKAEHPGRGDPFRSWGIRAGEHTLSWALQSRNKKCITLDLKHAEGQALARRLFRWADVVVENYRPGQLEKWRLGFEVIQEENPRCILARISGYGTSGPYRDKPAFGAIGEAMGELRHLSAHPPEIADLPPVRVGVSLGDEVATLYAVHGILSAVYERDVVGTGRGRCVDVALYEAVFSLLESAISDYSYAGKIRQPTGAALSSAAPSNLPDCRPNLARARRQFGRDLRPSRPAHGSARTRDRSEVPYQRRSSRQHGRARPDHRDMDREVSCRRAAKDARGGRGTGRARLHHRRLRKRRAFSSAWHAPGGRDPRGRPSAAARRRAEVRGRRSGGGVRWSGPALGAHNVEVYGGILGLSDVEIARLQAAGAV